MNEAQSLPSRERGLKFCLRYLSSHQSLVAPFAGAWIEIGMRRITKPYVRSLPSRERGLKFSPFARVRLNLRRSLRGSVD